ncbi:MAG: MFS transporter [Gemmatimonadetes bacterium]|nr:MFS transporter [Gemmatimonadota bacterium]
MPRTDSQPIAAASAPHPYLVLAALWILVFSVTSQVMMVAPVLPRIARELGIAEFRLGSLVTAYSVAVAAVALCMGPVSDRVGRRRMLLVGSVLMAAGLALHGVPGGYGWLLAVRIITGAGGGVLTGATAAYVGDYFPQERRGWANGWIMSGMAAGQILGIPMGTLLAAQSGFRAPFLVFAATMGASALLIWRFVPQPDVGRIEGSFGLRRSLSHYGRMIARPRIVAAAAAFLGMFLGASVYMLYLPTWLENTRGATAGQIATLFAVGGVATVLAGPSTGRLSDRVGRKGIIVAASLGLALAMVATTFLVTEVWIAYLVFLLVSALSAARAGPFQALMTEIVADEQRGSAMSLTMALGQIGTGLGAAIAGPAFGAAGYVGNAAMGGGAAVLAVHPGGGRLDDVAHDSLSLPTALPPAEAFDTATHVVSSPVLPGPRRPWLPRLRQQTG